ncbi:hypothetical protein E4T56_gene11433 [Termitomyces sp. T112]|nr:hypothetical protein E4T56_gene11433 [Termitomyces sp. T112]
MSSPSYSATPPTLLISDADVVIVYDSEREEFECQCRAGAIYQSHEQHRLVFLGWLTEFCRVVHGGVPQLVVGDAEGVPPLQQIPQAEVTVEEFARALAWAQGSPTLEWCQNKAPCVLCAWWGKACVFNVPSMGLQCDTSVCLPCCASHKKCLILLEWQAACVAVEQGWDEDWVQSQLGKVRKTWMLGEGSVGQSAGQVEPPWGGWREGAPSAADWAQANGRPSGVSCLLFYPRRGLGMGIKFSGAPAFDHRGLSSQAGGGANSSIDGMGRGALTGEGGSGHSTGREGGIGAGMEHLGWEVQPLEEAEEQEMALEGGSLQAELEVVRWREDWLANKAASELGVGALGSLGQCLCSICVNPRWVGTDAHESAPGVAAGDGKGGEVAGGALAV